MRHHKLPLLLLAIAAGTLFADGVEWWLRLGVSALLAGAAASIFMRRVGLTWGAFIGGFRRDH